MGEVKALDQISSKRLKTLESFDYQWKHLSEAPYLLSDIDWRKNVSSYILDELGLTREDIRGKRVLDAGCGNGRWAYGFVQLGCEVFGFDPSKNGIEYAREHVDGCTFDVADVLDIESLKKIYPGESFDIVWCWGVLHHTGDPELGFVNLLKFLAPSGRIHLYLYGKRRKIKSILSFVYNLFPFEIRVFLSKMLSKINQVSAHSNFDRFSPPISISHSEDEVRHWFVENSLTFKRVYPRWASGSTDLFISGMYRQPEV